MSAPLILLVATTFMMSSAKRLIKWSPGVVLHTMTGSTHRGAMMHTPQFQMSAPGIAPPTWTPSLSHQSRAGRIVALDAPLPAGFVWGYATGEAGQQTIVTSDANNTAPWYNEFGSWYSGLPAFNNHKSTKDNYAQMPDAETPPTEDQFFGVYRDIRQGLDHGYHGVYNLERQLWQDATIRPMLAAAPPFRKKPWMIYTAGGMGVGKGRALDRLSKDNIVAWENMVNVNADNFKSLMPEYPLYPLRGVIEPKNLTGRGGMTHQESAYMQEVATEAALRRSSDILVDSSFKDPGWYCGSGSRTSSDPNSENWKGDILRIKDTYPQYRIAIFHVLMDFPDDDANRSKFKNTLTDRLEGRAMKTGRAVPLELALESVDGAARSVSCAMERGLIDLYAELDNTDKLRLLTFIDESGNSHDESGLDWEILREKFPPMSADIPRK